MSVKKLTDRSLSTGFVKMPDFKRRDLAAAVGIVSVVLSVGFTGTAFAAKGGTPGKPGGSGAAPDLGDLIVLYRDEYGRPIPTDSVQVPDPETGELVDAGLCQQPLAAPGVGLPEVTLPGGEIIPECLASTESCVIAVNPLNCAAVPEHAEFTQEVDFGRTSVIRAPDTVLDQSLGEVITKVSTAQCTTLDPAGRLVNTSEVDGDIFSATIDSPLENLAIYWQYMLNGQIGTPSNPLILPGGDVLTTAARGLGAAIDKTGKVTIDQIVYTNQIMGLVDTSTQFGTMCVDVREEVQGTMQLVEKCVLDYGSYAYDRSLNFQGLPSPPYIPQSAPQAGNFEYLSYKPGTNPPEFTIAQESILEGVFLNEVFDGVNIAGFSQAADDAREVIEFTHNHPLPLGFETPVPLCDDPNQNTKYDLSISEESGLQVPTQIVDGSEGREFTVTVANAGPAAVSGDIVVTADAANGGEIVGSPWTIPFTDLGAGQSYSKTTFFSIDLGERTTIEWTAEATAVPGCDGCEVNPADNSVTATSSVKVTGSGGGTGGGGGGPGKGQSGG
ncbi:hypothetical protein R0135_15240 [Congregibacter variabilis]|uniref:DUF11 domain-containing protein n=1 Tax=Congregibacter variabilis TaxID=3081200 RepID=A0ABZ0I268_9GAMM|nr:hypothetical protein R0135_15240 [Congregibacter sp. IMCC43200]